MHYPKVVLEKSATEKDHTGVERAIVSADQRCSIGNLLKEAGVDLTIESEITTE